MSFDGHSTASLCLTARSSSPTVTHPSEKDSHSFTQRRRSPGYYFVAAGDGLADGSFLATAAGFDVFIASTAGQYLLFASCARKSRAKASLPCTFGGHASSRNFDSSSACPV